MAGNVYCSPVLVPNQHKGKKGETEKETMVWEMNIWVWFPVSLHGMQDTETSQKVQYYVISNSLAS